MNAGRKMSLGSKLRQFRDAHGMTQEEASKLSGISGANISRLEDNQSPRVAASTLAALARAYGVDVRELYRAAGWYSTPPNILKEEAKELAPEEQLLIDTIRSAPTPSFRRKLLRSLLDVARVARDADAERHLGMAAKAPADHGIEDP